MNKGIWFLAGTAAGAYAVTRARRAAEALTYDGLHDRLSGLFVGARLFASEVRQGAGQKEAELRERLELAPPAAQQPTDMTPLPLERQQPLTLVRGKSH
jgi:uncharacterized protein DUF6167